MHNDYVITNAGKIANREAFIASLYPIRTDLKEFLDIVGDDNRVNVHSRLVYELRNKFKAHYGSDATFLTRAPGRVILIGEHLDYNGLPVVSAALKQETMISGRLDETNYIDIQHMD